MLVHSLEPHTVYLLLLPRVSTKYSREFLVPENMISKHVCLSCPGSLFNPVRGGCISPWTLRKHNFCFEELITSPSSCIYWSMETENKIREEALWNPIFLFLYRKKHLVGFWWVFGQSSPQLNTPQCSWQVAFIATQNFMPLVNLSAAHLIAIKFSFLTFLCIPIFLKIVTERNEIKQMK